MIASGGLTHFVIDEDVDNAVMDALKSRKIEGVASRASRSFKPDVGSPNWVPVASLMADLGFPPTVIDYVPCYRSSR